MIVKIYIITFIISVGLLSAINGASFSNVYVERETVPVRYYRGGAPYTYSSIDSPHLAQINNLLASPTAYITPCISPCMIPASVSTVRAPANVLASNSQYTNVPVVVAPSKEETTGYEYSYVVYDENTGDHKTQRELSDGTVVRGEYSFLQPDGYVREVQYVADDLNGFNAVVKHYLPFNLESKRVMETKKRKGLTPPCHEVQKESLKEASSEELKVNHSNEPEHSQEPEHSHGSEHDHESEHGENFEHSHKAKYDHENKESHESEHDHEPKINNEPEHSLEPEHGDEPKHGHEPEHGQKPEHGHESEQSEPDPAHEPEHKPHHYDMLDQDHESEPTHNHGHSLEDEHGPESGHGHEPEPESKKSKTNIRNSKEPANNHHKKSNPKDNTRSEELFKEESDESEVESSEEIPVGHGKRKDANELMISQHKTLIPYHDVIRCIQAILKRAQEPPTELREEPSPLTYIVLNKPC